MHIRIELQGLVNDTSIYHMLINYIRINFADYKAVNYGIIEFALTIQRMEIYCKMKKI